MKQCYVPVGGRCYVAVASVLQSWRLETFLTVERMGGTDYGTVLWWWYGCNMSSTVSSLPSGRRLTATVVPSPSPYALTRAHTKPPLMLL